MLNTAELICFAATTRPDEARHFYESVLGLTLVEENPFALVFDANGTMLRLQKVEDFTPARHTTLGWTVPDISGTIAALVERGVRFERYERLSQDALGIWTSPSGARIAWFLDPDGNGLSLTEWPSA